MIAYPEPPFSAGRLSKRYAEKGVYIYCLLSASAADSVTSDLPIFSVDKYSPSTGNTGKGQGV